MTANIHAVSLVADGAGDASHVAALFENKGDDIGSFDQLERGSETCGARANNESAPFTHLVLVLCRDVFGRRRGTLAEEILFHLLDEEFLRFFGTKVQPVLIHEHFHVLNPHAPCLFRDVVVNALAKRMAFERDLGEPFHFAIQFDAIDLTWRRSRLSTHQLQDSSEKGFGRKIAIDEKGESTPVAMPRKRQLPRDPVESAAAAGLRYGGHQSPGYTRRRSGKGFIYFDDGRRLTDREALVRIRSLVIPPAWTNVWVSRDPSGHLQAVGYDARGRKQYRYHAAYRTIRNQTKFDRMPEVVAAIAAARGRVAEHLALSGMPREKVLAALIRLLDVTGMRVGNECSAAENHTFGLTTLRNQHVDVEGATLRFHFVGKSGVKHEMEITDRRLARIVRQCHDLPGQQLFEYLDESGELRTVSSSDVNSYLHEASGQTLTAKDFRTWAGTVECAVALREMGEFSSETEAKRNIVAAIRTAAEKLGNRVATCRAYYVHPAVTDSYLEGGLLRAMQNGEGDTVLSADECAVLKIVKNYRLKRE